MPPPQLPNVFSGKVLTLAFWLVMIVSLTLFFNGILLKKEQPNYDLQSREFASGEVTLKRNQAGHYLAPGLINGEEVNFLLDTGATNVSVPGSVAERLGLQKGRPSMVTTASGRITVYDTVLDSVQLGGVHLNGVRASINPHMPENIVLLGMSFMKHLDITQRDGILTLSVPSQD